MRKNTTPGGLSAPDIILPMRLPFVQFVGKEEKMLRECVPLLR